MNKNPIFVEYYSHRYCDCYKVRNPWTKYRDEKFVLCLVTEGLDKAREEAKKRLLAELDSALAEPIEETK